LRQGGKSIADITKYDAEMIANLIKEESLNEIVL
jgi:hypothetical protein